MKESFEQNQTSSYWLQSLTLPSFQKLEEDTHVDVAIVGGGITGITTAYLLTKAGYKVALIEASKFLHGTTGHTTAKITSQHDLIYDEFVHHLGEEKSKQYYDVNEEAIAFIKKSIAEHSIACEFSEQDAYLYATTNHGVHRLEKEFNAYQQLGISGHYVDKIPLDVRAKAALKIGKQAQFHPLKYLQTLLTYISAHGGLLYENTVAKDIEEDTKVAVITNQQARVYADQIVIATHFPFYDGGSFYFSKLHAERSYIVAGTIPGTFPEGMYLSADNPKRSLRYTEHEGKQLILLGGESHKAGQGMNPLFHYEAIQQFGTELFGEFSPKYHWSAQDLVSLDKLPYIGKLKNKKKTIYVATAYRKWGMTTGTAAAQIVTKQILDEHHPAEALFDPSRFIADPSIRHFLSENINVAKHLIQGKVEQAYKKIEELGKDEGAVVEWNGEKTGAYKDHDGHLHLVDTTCTHMGCETNWNQGDRTWDCPCHGSRFSYRGDVIEGPAKEPLKQVKNDL
ncbi:FAD-dependent oxidoreductase [Alkalihalobacillus pseudalcaliphilus]|uniref:FAD-dependent oxidoreductase n=1 Tax=Alkalihalobacillus pseudalcaliphilus TaxID=79884 RepID=UPI00064DCC5B|nr:FAD-dependent oxidoreductase [Alkalihalobacillus pseudalcaliphilus]KMK78182.1 (2Fe-2S)-binding protein [Alkalihalobacillus pseudalcaliphilus]